MVDILVTIELSQIALLCSPFTVPDKTSYATAASFISVIMKLLFCYHNDSNNKI